MQHLMAVAAASSDVTDWFECLYSQAKGQVGLIPWADLEPNSKLAVWLQRENPQSEARMALDVGCGIGDNAEYLAQYGFTVTAFDVAPTAIEWCRKRFKSSKVKYLAASVLELPQEWSGTFDFVHECYTLQVLPEELRVKAMREIARCVKPGGTILIICRGRDASQAYDKSDLPWPLTREELRYFESAGFNLVKFEDYMDMESTPKRRFRVEYRKLLSI